MDTSSTATDAPARAVASYFSAVEAALWVAGFIYQALGHLVRYDLGFDQLVQFTATQNSLQGRGLGVLVAVLTDLSSARSMKVLFWPPGWSLLQVPFVALVRSDYWAVCLSDLAALALLLVAIRSILNRVASSFSVPVRLLLILSLGFVTPPNGTWWYANIWGEAFFVSATALIMPRGHREAPDYAYFISGWLLGACVWMRYQYLSTVGVIALVILLQGHFRKSIVPLAIHLGGLAVSLLPLAYWRFFSLGPGAAAFDWRVMFTRAGLHFGSLIYTPAPAAVALGSERWHLAMASPVQPAYLARMGGAMFLGCVGWMLTIVAVIGAVTARQNRSIDAPTRAGLRRFYAVGLGGYLFNLALLEYMSVIRNIDISGWLYVQIFRYHMIVSVFVMFALAHFVSTGRGRAGAVLKVFVLAVGVWLTTLQAPQAAITFRRLVRGDWGPPLEARFWNRGAAVRYLTNRYDESRHNVLIHLGPANNEATYVLSMARFSGYAASATSRPEILETVSPVHLALTTPATSGPELRNKFDALCAELGPETTVGSMVFCDGRFLPRHRGHS